MAMYNVPPDINESEKIVGGLITGAQLIWIVIGLGGWALFGLPLFDIIGIPGFIIGAFPLPITLVFAFKRKHELSYLKYLRTRKKHKRKVKEISNQRIF